MSSPEKTSSLSTSDKPIAEFWYALQPFENDIVCLREIHVDPYALHDGDQSLAWPPDNPTLYTASLWRFRSLPVNVVYAGHYGSFDGERMIEIIDEHLLDLNRC